MGNQTVNTDQKSTTANKNNNAETCWDKKEKVTVCLIRDIPTTG